MPTVNTGINKIIWRIQKDVSVVRIQSGAQRRVPWKETASRPPGASPAACRQQWLMMTVPPGPAWYRKKPCPKVHPPCQSQRCTMGSEMARVEITAHSDLDKSLIRHPWPLRQQAMCGLFLNSGSWLFLRARPSHGCRAYCAGVSYSCLYFKKEEIRG